MTIRLDDTVRDIVLADFRAAAVFHRYGIPFCCGGECTLAQACRDRCIDQSGIVADIQHACRTHEAPVTGFAEWETETLVAYIVSRHHAYVRLALPAIAAHAAKVAAAHGDSHPWMREVAQIADRLQVELTAHLSSEENVLFPFVVANGDAVRSGEDLPEIPLDRIDQSVRVLEAEHRAATDGLARIRELTGGFAPPPGACATFRVCLQELEAFARDLQAHVHIEDEVLFPRVRGLAVHTAHAGH